MPTSRHVLLEMQWPPLAQSHSYSWDDDVFIGSSLDGSSIKNTRKIKETMRCPLLPVLSTLQNSHCDIVSHSSGSDLCCVHPGTYHLAITRTGRKLANIMVGMGMLGGIFRDSIYSLAVFAYSSFLEPPGWTEAQIYIHSAFTQEHNTSFFVEHCRLTHN